MGIKFDDHAKLTRAAFRRRFSTPAAVREFVEMRGCQADEQLPELRRRQKTIQENVDTLRIIGGEPFSRAQEALWNVTGEIEDLKLWQQIRDCLAAGLLRIEITSRFVHFTARRRRICHFGPGPGGGLEFTQAGRQELERLFERARQMRKV